MPDTAEEIAAREAAAAEAEAEEARKEEERKEEERKKEARKVVRRLPPPRSERPKDDDLLGDISDYLAKIHKAVTGKAPPPRSFADWIPTIITGAIVLTLGGWYAYRWWRNREDNYE